MHTRASFFFSPLLLRAHIAVWKFWQAVLLSTVFVHSSLNLSQTGTVQAPAAQRCLLRLIHKKIYLVWCLRYGAEDRTQKSRELLQQTLKQRDC